MAKFVTWLQIYQIYGRKPVDEVHVILRRYNSSYIILEDSICMQPTTNQCGTPTLIDMYNGVVSDQHWPADPRVHLALSIQFYYVCLLDYYMYM